MGKRKCPLYIRRFGSCSCHWDPTITSALFLLFFPDIGGAVCAVDSAPVLLSYQLKEPHIVWTLFPSWFRQQIQPIHNCVLDADSTVLLLIHIINWNGDYMSICLYNFCPLEWREDELFFEVVVIETLAETEREGPFEEATWDFWELLLLCQIELVMRQTNNQKSCCVPYNANAFYGCHRSVLCLLYFALLSHFDGGFQCAPDCWPLPANSIWDKNVQLCDKFTRPVKG